MKKCGKDKISVRPKPCAFFDHTLQQIVDFDGIAEKVEDYVERAHQVGKKLDQSNEYKHKHTNQTNTVTLQ